MMNEQIFLCTFGSVFFGFLYLSVKIYLRKRAIQSFLKVYHQEQKKKNLDKIIEKVVFFRKLEMLIKDNRIKITIKQFLLVALGCAMVGAILGYVLSNFVLMAIVVAITASSAPYFYVLRKDAKRNREIASQFSLFLKQVASYQESGNNLRQSLEKVALITDGALGNLLEEIIGLINSGVSATEAIEYGVTKTTLIEFKMFFILVNIHSDMGGTMHHSLTNLRAIMEEKKSLRNEIDDLTQETKVSAYLTAVVPMVLYLAMRLASKEYVKQIENMPYGKYGIVASFVFIMLGVVAVKKISNVKVDKAYR